MMLSSSSSPPSLQELLLRDYGLCRRPKRTEDGRLLLGVYHDIEIEDVPEPVLLALLEYDLDRARRACGLLLPRWSSLDSVRQDVLVHVAFSLGWREFLCHTRLLTCVEKGEWLNAARYLQNLGRYLTPPSRTRQALLLELGSAGVHLALKTERSMQAAA